MFAQYREVIAGQQAGGFSDSLVYSGVHTQVIEVNRIELLTSFTTPRMARNPYSGRGLHGVSVVDGLLVP